MRAITPSPPRAARLGPARGPSTACGRPRCRGSPGAPDPPRGSSRPRAASDTALTDRRLGRADLVDLRLVLGESGALEQRRADRCGVLESRVVVGDHEDVAALGGDARHLVALGRIPVAVGAEHHDRAAGRELAHRAEGVLERVGAVAEVDVDAGAAVSGDALGAAGQIRLDAAVGIERRSDRLELEPGLDEHDDRQRRVGRHVPADQRLPGDQRAPLGAGEPELGERRALVGHLDDPLGGLDVVWRGVADGRDRGHRDPRLLDDAAPYAVSRQTTPRFARSGWKSGSFAWKYSSMSA